MTKGDYIRSLQSTKSVTAVTDSYKIVGKQVTAHSRKFKRTFRKRFVRYGLIGFNIALIAGVILFVTKNPHSSSSLKTGMLNSQSNHSIASNPLDELSSADIAVQVARLARLPETTSVANNADSQNEQLNVVASGNQTISKPQIVETALKSNKDIKSYKVKTGDTLAELASKFGVTSDSIKWSNSLTGDTLTVDKVLNIPPVNGVAYVIKSGDTIDSLAERYRASRDQFVADNDTDVLGLKTGELVLIRDGSIPPPVAVYNGFAWGGSSAIYQGNGYDYGWCTWYVAVRRAELGRPVPSNLGNAYSWYRLAQRAGLPTGLKPSVGAVAVNEGSNHVSVVEAVNADGSFMISEMNSYGFKSPELIGNPAGVFGGWNRKDFKTVASVGNLKFIY